jgi:maleylpyruvate isomerase
VVLDLHGTAFEQVFALRSGGRKSPRRLAQTLTLRQPAENPHLRGCDGRDAAAIMRVMDSSLQVPVARVREAQDRLARTVVAMDSESYGAPSLLPGWTRGHVVAHLALNAEGLARAVTGVQTGTPETMYDSQEARDRDIEVLADEPPVILRERLAASSDLLVNALDDLDEADWSEHFDRTPGGQGIAVRAVPLMRLREVEIHHVDLDAGYTVEQWDPDFSRALIGSMAKRGVAEPLRVVATDLDEAWDLGAVQDGRSVVVSGTAAALGWWLTGRGAGTDLECQGGPLPRIGPW